MVTPETIQIVGIAKRDNTIDNACIRNCPVYLDNAIDVLLYFSETQFKYMKDIQIESAHIGFTKLRDSIHISKYKEIMDIVKYGNNPDIHISGDQRAKQDAFEFTGSKLSRVLNFKISSETRNSLYALGQKLDIVQSNLDTMAYVLGYQEMLSNASSDMFNASNKELLNTLTNECKRIDRFFELRTIHKIIEFCPVEIDHSKNTLSWRI